MAIGVPKFGWEAERHTERSGKVNERFVFGRARVDDPEYTDMLHALIKRRQGSSFRDAMELVKRFQPFLPESHTVQDPTDPPKQFPKSLREAVAQRLGLEGKAAQRVHFWTAVDSIVDTNFKADAVIELVGEGGEPSRYVRLDAKLSPEPQYEPEQDTRNRVLVGEVPDVYEQPNTYREFVRDTADAVARKLAVQEPVARQGSGK